MHFKECIKIYDEDKVKWKAKQLGHFELFLKLQLESIEHEEQSEAWVVIFFYKWGSSCHLPINHYTFFMNNKTLYFYINKQPPRPRAANAK